MILSSSWLRDVGSIRPSIGHQRWCPTRTNRHPGTARETTRCVLPTVRSCCRPPDA